MKICLAQVKSIKGEVQLNLEQHLHWIRLAIENDADLICFPELSMTGYEPALAADLATDENDDRWNEIQRLSDEHDISICFGLPIKGEKLPTIGMVIISPKLERQVYNKQLIHDDEHPFFAAGESQLFLSILGEKITPAICYESMIESHLSQAKDNGATIYIASVAKDKKGLVKANTHYPVMAQKYQIPVLMSNCVGYCDNFESAGSSGIWNEGGQLIDRLDETNEGLLIYDCETFNSLAVLNTK